MGIERAVKNKDNPYFVTARSVPQDESLSWEARGVMYYLLSKPDDWQVQPKDLQQNCGRDKVYKILTELLEAGYLSRTQSRSDEQKFIDGEYLVHEIKQKPLPEKPYTESPYTVNTHLTEYRVLQSTESTYVAQPPATRDPIAEDLDAPIASKQLEARKALAIAADKLSSPFTLVSKPIIQTDGSVVNTASEVKEPERLIGRNSTPSSPLPEPAEPQTVKTARARDVLYDAIQECLFKGNGTGPLVGKVKKALLKITPVDRVVALPDDLRAMAVWYNRENPTANLPLGPDKVCYWLNAWRNRPVENSVIDQSNWQFVEPEEVYQPGASS